MTAAEGLFFFRAGDLCEITRRTLWASAVPLASGGFGEDGRCGFGAPSDRFAIVVGAQVEGHVPCATATEIFWIPLESLKFVQRIPAVRSVAGDGAVARP